MSRRTSSLWPVASAVLGVIILGVALPQEWKMWAPGFLQRPALHLGLDLAGGTQLDFRISEEEIASQLEKVDAEIAALERDGGSPERLTQLRFERASIEEQRANLVEAIRTVIERRINALGVSEASITPSFIGNEKHLLVECPGVVDTQECIEVVGKTIQLEFKEQFTEATEEYTAEVRATVAATVRRLTFSGSTLEKEGQDLGDELGISYTPSQAFYRDQLPKVLESMWTEQPFEILQKEGSVTVPRQSETGQVTEEEVPGIFLAAVLGPRTMTGRLINEAPKAFELLQKSEANATYTTHANAPLDAKFSPRLAAAIRGMQPGQLRVVALEGSGSAAVVFLRGFTKGGEQAEVSHILVAYKGASGADASITRTKEEALAKAKTLKQRLNQGANFAALARSDSDSPSGDLGGKLGAFGRGTMMPSFEEAAFKLPPGSISDPVETQFGYHLIKIEKPVVLSPDRASYDQLLITAGDAETRGNQILARLQAGEVRSQEETIPLRILFFSLKPTGWKDTPLDGKHFRTAAVVPDPVLNRPVVQITFDEEGGKLFQELTRRNIGKPIAIFVGGEMVSAPTVQAEISGGTAVITGSQNFDEAKLLAQDLNTGAIPAPIHLVGQHTIEATLGATALRTSLQAALLGTILLMLYMALVYRLLGLVANIALFIYAALFFALLKLPVFLFSNTFVVLTLAGMAGIILSLGMAVDANVLVFERMKEELRKGKLVKTAVETSFQHAWPAIRDGNVSTIITCLILFIVGTSIVRGFAVTLMIGVALSMFTAITVTRWILRRVALMPVSQNLAAFGIRRGAELKIEN